jgi:hypothetical protein
MRVAQLKRAARSAARSAWMSAAGATAVILGTAGTYVSGTLAGEAQTCDVRRELLRANGSPELRAGRAALLKISEARAYLLLAVRTKDLDQRREYAFLGVAAANAVDLGHISTEAGPLSKG